MLLPPGELLPLGKLAVRPLELELPDDPPEEDGLDEEGLLEELPEAPPELEELLGVEALCC